MNVSAKDRTATFGGRLEAIKSHFASSVVEFVDMVDISRSAYYDWIELSEPKREAVGAIVSALPTVSVAWLNTGQGEMLREQSGLPAPAENAHLLQGEAYPENGETFILTIYQDVHVAAGAGNVGYVCEGLEETAVKVREYKQLFFDLLEFWPPDDMRSLRVQGDSMYPTFRPGQLVLFKPVERLVDMVNLRRYIIEIENQMTGDWEPYAKRISRLPGGGFRVISDNKAAGEPNFDLVPENGHLVSSLTEKAVNVSVLGEVLWPPDGAADRQVEMTARALEQVLEQRGGI